MALAGKAAKFLRKTIVSDKTINKTVTPLVSMVDKKISDNIKVPDVLGIEVEEAKEILESVGFRVSILEMRKPNKKYANYKSKEVVDMEYPKPNAILKGIPRGSVVKIYIADESIIKKSRSWMRNVID